MCWGWAQGEPHRAQEWGLIEGLCQDPPNLCSLSPSPGTTLSPPSQLLHSRNILITPHNPISRKLLFFTGEVFKEQLFHLRTTIISGSTVEREKPTECSPPCGGTDRTGPTSRLFQPTQFHDSVIPFYDSPNSQGQTYTHTHTKKNINVLLTGGF